jgi:CubicO group peptidase (beta-lactamase class C family)
MEALPRTCSRLEDGIAEGLHFGAQLAVSLQGKSVADVALGNNAPFDSLERDHLMLWLSACKPVAAVAAGILMDRGMLDLDTPVAHWIPDFGSHRKEHITSRHLLTHTAGIRGATLGWVPRPWAEAIGLICYSRPEPHWEPGEQAGYHVDSAWYMLGELVRVIDGRPYEHFVRGEIFLPLGMDHCWVGMDDAEFDAHEDRVALSYNSAGETPEILDDLCRRESVTACRPGGNGRGPANELLKLYEAMAAMTRGGAGILRPETARKLVSPQRVGMMDKTFRKTIDWGLGFMLQSDHYAPGETPYQFGSFAPRGTFGHCGNQSTAAFHDPQHQLSAVVLTNGLPGEERHQTRMRGILDELYRELDLV